MKGREKSTCVGLRAAQIKKKRGDQHKRQTRDDLEKNLNANDRGMNLNDVISRVSRV